VIHDPQDVEEKQITDGAPECTLAPMSQAPFRLVLEPGKSSPRPPPSPITPGLKQLVTALSVGQGWNIRLGIQMSVTQIVSDLLCNLGQVSSLCELCSLYDRDNHWAQ
jgi:hypothetical protein